MRRFLINAAVFTTFFSILLVCIDCIHISDEYLIYKTKGTDFGKKMAWNLDLINHHSERIPGSLVFFGPSHTEMGVCDSTLNAEGIPALNMGISQLGNDVELYFLGRIIGFRPRKVYMNLSKFKVRSIHPLSPMLYTPAELLSAGQSAFSTDFVIYLFKRATFALDYLVWRSSPHALEQGFEPLYGVRHEKGEFSPEKYAAVSDLETSSEFENATIAAHNFTYLHEAKRSGLYFTLIKLRRRFIHAWWNVSFISNVSSQQRFVMKAFELAKKHRVEIAELYIPFVADARSHKEFSPLFYVPRETPAVASVRNFTFLDSCAYWDDLHHLNAKGGILLTKEMIRQGVLPLPAAEAN